jgi:hypothetical protein
LSYIENARQMFETGEVAKVTIPET